MQLALPSRDYYLKPSSEGDLKAYHKYMTEVATLLGANATQAEQELMQVIQFERRLANVSSPNSIEFLDFLSLAYTLLYLLSVSLETHDLVLKTTLKFP